MASNVDKDNEMEGESNYSSRPQCGSDEDSDHIEHAVFEIKAGNWSVLICECAQLHESKTLSF